MSANHAADQIKSLAAKFKGLFVLAEELEKIGSLDQAARDAQIRKEKAYADADKAMKEYEHNKIALEKAKAEIVEVEEKAKSIEASANKKASELIASAQEKIKLLQSAFDEKSLERNNKLSELHAHARNLEAEIQLKKSELASLQKEIAGVKAKVAALAG